MLIWLKDAPNADETQTLLKGKLFHEKIKACIKANIRAHLDGFDIETVQSMPQESQLPYSRLPDPESPDWEDQICTLE
jgi:hypothetical protein